MDTQTERKVGTDSVVCLAVLGIFIAYITGTVTTVACMLLGYALLLRVWGDYHIYRLRMNILEHSAPQGSTTVTVTPDTTSDVVEGQLIQESALPNIGAV